MAKRSADVLGEWLQKVARVEPAEQSVGEVTAIQMESAALAAGLWKSGPHSHFFGHPARA